MPFVIRDKTDGRVIGIESLATTASAEELSWEDPDILAFFTELKDKEQERECLSTTNFITLRLMEDLIDLITESKSPHFKKQEELSVCS